MSTEMTVSCSQGRPAEWHDTIMQDGRRLTGPPKNADAALAAENEHWIGEPYRTDADRFNAIFQESVDSFNAKQTRADRKMGEESSKPERQKSYYDGIVDGTFCYGSGKQKETPIYEVVLQIGNRDDNGVTTADFDVQHWKELKHSGREAEASEYVLQHLNNSPNKERTKRILHRAVERIQNLDPEHLIVARADLHGDEPAGTCHCHLALILRGTGYSSGMESRVASVRALEQMGFVKTPDQEYGIVQLHEKFKEVVAEEMKADALEHGYPAIERKADSGEHRKHTDVETFRQMAAQQAELNKVTKQQEDTQRKLDVQGQQTKGLVNLIYDFMQELTGKRPRFSKFSEARAAIHAAIDNFKRSTLDAARKQAEAEAEAEYREREAALEAQRAVLNEMEELRNKLAVMADTDTSRRRFLETHRTRSGRSLEEVYQADLQEFQGRKDDMLRKGEALTAQYYRLYGDAELPQREFS